MTDYATLSDGTHTATFIMDKDWRPAIEEVGAKHSPLGYPFFVKSTGGTKGVGGSFDIVSDNDTDTATVITILKGTGQLTLTLPNGDSYAITLDPATPRTGSKQFSLMLWFPVMVWTVSYFQVA